jgi:hypothetical protein
VGKTGVSAAFVSLCLRVCDVGGWEGGSSIQHRGGGWTCSSGRVSPVNFERRHLYNSPSESANLSTKSG